MARAGILYSHVATAAAKLVEDGKNPTVDNVREALGSTGSKSTIAPFLKRWKGEHQGTVAQIERGVPPTLLQAVKGVYESMQAEFKEKLEQARQAHQHALHAAAGEAQRLRAENRTFSDANSALSASLGRANETIAQMQTEDQSLRITLASAQSENAGLQQRLSDRQTEVDGLHRQMNQARTQFEHYQESAAAQRAEERQQAEQYRLRLESELLEVRQTTAVQRTTITHGDQEMTRLHQDKDRVSTELSSLKTAHAALASEHHLQAHEVKISSAFNAELRSQVDTLSGTLAQAKSEVAILSAERPQLQERIATLEAKVQSLLVDNMGLAIDKARLEGLHSQSITKTVVPDAAQRAPT